MSRIGKKPITVPDNITVTVDGLVVSVKGPLGDLSRSIRPEIEVEIAKDVIMVKRKSDSRRSRSFHGLTRTLIANMVEGVGSGFKKELEMAGVGYKAKMEGNELLLWVGFSHSFHFNIPQGITVKTAETKIEVFGIDKELVGKVASEIRKVKPCEPYKGKGIKYVGEVIRRKAGKSAKVGTAAGGAKK